MCQPRQSNERSTSTGGPTFSLLTHVGVHETNAHILFQRAIFGMIYSNLDISWRGRVCIIYNLAVKGTRVYLCITSSDAGYVKQGPSYYI